MKDKKPKLNVVEFPAMPGTQDIPAALRLLAAQIEAGEFADAHNLVWVIDCGNCNVQFGMMGPSESPGSQAHLLLSLACHRILVGCSE